MAMAVVDEGGAGLIGVGARPRALRAPFERPHEGVRRRRCAFNARAVHLGLVRPCRRVRVRCAVRVARPPVPPNAAGSVGGCYPTIPGPMGAFAAVFVGARDRPLVRIAH